MLAVVAYHYEGGYMPGGYLGVTAFFVLSGYLITGMLAVEHTNTRHIDLPAFYARRALRLYPALVVAVAGTLVLGTLVRSDGMPLWRLYAASGFSLLYVNDFVVAAGHITSWLDVTWSLGVEEQFYLLWPLLLLAALRGLPARDLGLGCVAVAILAGIVEAVLVPAIPPGWVYFSPIGNVMPLLLGAGLSFAPMCARRVGAWLACGGAAALIALALAGPGLGTVTSSRGPEQLAAISSAAVIWFVADGGFSLLGSRVMVWLGRRSYGIYLIHEPVPAALYSVLPHAGEDTLIGVPLSVGLAALSYRYVEQPFLRRKTRFSRANRASTSPRVSTQPSVDRR
jgi:peptidoglycan/LPS O-acetylase OafA/YrhL